jgi:hypothetical protein
MKRIFFYMTLVSIALMFACKSAPAPESSPTTTDENSSAQAVPAQTVPVQTVPAQETPTQEVAVREVQPQSAAVESQAVSSFRREYVTVKTNSFFSITTRGRDGQSRNRDSSSAMGNTLFSSNIPDRQRPIYPPTQEYWGLDPRGKGGQGVKLTTTLHIVQMLRTTEAIPLLHHTP